MRGPTRAERRERGSALTSTMIFLTIALLALMGSFDRLHQVIRFEESSQRVPSTSDGSAEALGMGIARLNTGIPPDDDYTCRERLRSSDGSDVLAFDVTYDRTNTDRWDVTVAPAGGAAPDCPAAFEETCPL